MKKNKALLHGYRLKLAVFLNNEYAMRSIISNDEYKTYIEQLPALKNELQENLGKLYNTSIADACIEYHLYHSPEYYDMDIFCDMIYKRVLKHAHGHSINDNIEFENAYDLVTLNAKNKDLISKLSEISIKHGVYATRADAFGKKTYPLELINEENIEKITEETFFNINILNEINPTLTHSTTDSAPQQLKNAREGEQNSTPLFTETHNKNIEREIRINKLTTSMVAYEQQPSSAFTTNTAANQYLNAFYNTNNIKDIHKEISNKIFGLLMWDMTTLKKMKQKPAFKEISKNIKIARKKPCVHSTCNEECSDFESCLNAASRHLRIARNSIKAGTLKTAKDL
ncbi:hypothetical protein [Nitratidesulfovibrio liaohensis]|uniref:Uncharacterized protein n=1 Tax=Nitratidesulfovibrio liaohensis TaxID=2604158 RepID=A0ABY9R2A9_9BACT|nr:hypothetical protein [Nitratidesulfovibrio liaohensis]WMW64695.1 hypothetical protein KPS_002752 [Nitratidesulfovibrio liaohensis]